MRNISVGLFLIFFTACSTQKNRFVNRQYHRMTTAYNVLFNGEEAFKVGKSILDASVEDNFFELLEVEPITLSGEDINTRTMVPGFERAEEKAVKAIQKHSMRFEGIQRNDQIDEAYLLLGKARYYDRRFFPALEAFNFLLESYGSQEAYLEGIVWREKTNIRLLNNEIAIGNLRPLARKLLTKNKFYGAANATVAQAFINLKQYDSAQYYISKAAQYDTNEKRKGRYYFISGQLHEKAFQSDSALVAYENVLALRKKTERKYWLHAKIKQQLLLAQRDSLDPENNLLSLLRKFENRAFTHVIYRALGTYYLNRSEDSLAKMYFTASQKEPTLNEPTQKANYRDLADFYFRYGAYEKTGAYLDSLIPLLNKSPLAQKRTIRKRNNLEGILKYENNIRLTDSLLALLSLPKEAQKAYFEQYLEAKKKNVAAIVESNLAASKKQRLFSNSKESKFYFYRPNLVAQGKQSFLASWGNRPNVDNWRSAQRLIAPMKTEQQQQVAITTPSIQVEDLETLLAQLPAPTEKDSLLSLNHQSYLQAGLLYKEQFDNVPMAVQRLDTVLSLNPTALVAAPALYHRFRIAESQDEAIAADYKRRLINTYPESPYAQLLTNPEFAEKGNASSPALQYQKLLKAYQTQDFLKAQDLAQTLSVLLSATEWAPKIALIQAHVSGKLQGKATWIQQLEMVRQQYPQSETASYIESLLAQLEASESTSAKTYAMYKWVLPFDRNNTIGLNKTKQQIQKALLGHQALSLSVDPYNETHQFLVVHGFHSPEKVKQLQQNLQLLVTDDISNPKLYNFVVLSKEYQDIQVHKTWFPSPKTMQQ